MTLPIKNADGPIGALCNKSESLNNIDLHAQGKCKQIFEVRMSF